MHDSAFDDGPDTEAGDPETIAGLAMDRTLTLRVLRLTWQQLFEDQQACLAGPLALCGARAAPHHGVRFISSEGLERTRAAIQRLCRLHGAAADETAYFSTHWLQRFAPRPS